MLTVNNLTKRYGDVLANSKVTFTAEDGQITLMVGPNGAGKSTAIKCIAGLLRFQGEVLIGPYRNKTLEAKRIFGYIPELPVMYDSLTVYEHLEFIGRAYGVKDWKQRADQLLERMELSDKVKKLGKELSKGMQQKVSICCALLPRPQVCLLYTSGRFSSTAASRSPIPSPVLAEIRTAFPIMGISSREGTKSHLFITGITGRPVHPRSASSFRVTSR